MQRSHGRARRNWSFTWKHRGRTRAIGPAAYEKYCTLGHGGITGIFKASLAQESLSKWLVDFNRNCLQSKRGFASRPTKYARPHEPVGSFNGGPVWVEDEQGTSKAHLATKNGLGKLNGTWVDMHNTPVSFDARRFHQVEPHEGKMWALAAYTPQAFKRCTPTHRKKLSSLGFPLTGNLT